MPAIKITQLNSLALVQDFGRFNHQHQGISVNGAADEYAFAKANHMLGNRLFSDSNNKHNDECASIEVFYGQLTFKVDDTCVIAITGADCAPTKIAQDGTSSSLTMWKIHKLNAGDTVALSRPSVGVISYISVKGGIQTKPFLGSRAQSVVPNEKLAELSPLSAGERLPLSSSCHQQIKTNTLELTKYCPTNFYQDKPLVLRFIPHQHWYNAPTHQQENFLHTTFSVNSKSNRMAYQFDLPTSNHNAGFKQLKQALSSAVNFGTIQLMPSGLPVVLMKDRQTMGGYPTLGSVFQVDLFRLAQLEPGQEVSFSPADISQAQSQLNAFYQRFM